MSDGTRRDVHLRAITSGLLIAAVSVLLTSCATTSKPTGKPTIAADSMHGRVPGAQSVTEGDELPVGTESANPDAVTLQKQGLSIRIHAKSAVLPIGTVPYDALSLPMISPDGRYAATQTGVPPDWSALEAHAEIEIPFATRVEVYRLDYTERTTTLVHTLDDQTLLGRGADQDGFLIEVPRSDGSRWIGKCAWESGKVQWLVDDENTNAFATLGPRGQIAWARRRPNRKYFELAVRDAEGRQWSVPDGGANWVFPTWSGTSHGLFVVRVQDERIELAHARAENPLTLLQSLRTMPVPGRPSVSTAYQMMNGQPLIIGTALPQREQLVFFHPTQRRCALWRPRALRDVFLFPAGSVAAIMDDADFGLAATSKDLIQQDVTDGRKKGSLLRGLLIPRRTARTDWPFVLLTPMEGQVGLTAMAFVE